MRISYYEPVLSEYYITKFEDNSNIFEIAVPLHSYILNDRYELKLVYTWGFNSDRTDINGLWEIGSDWVTSTFWHYLSYCPTEEDITIQEKNDIQTIKSKWINIPYNCRNCQHCLGYRKSGILKDDYFYCNCGIIGLTRDGGRKYGFQSCSEYKPKVKEK